MVVIDCKMLYVHNHNVLLELVVVLVTLGVLRLLLSRIAVALATEGGKMVWVGWVALGNSPLMWCCPFWLAKGRVVWGHGD